MHPCSFSGISVMIINIAINNAFLHYPVTHQAFPPLSFPPLSTLSIHPLVNLSFYSSILHWSVDSRQNVWFLHWVMLTPRSWHSLM